jgi:S-adenosylmethionine:tRNA ribosyltransferase-isomerase
MSPATQPIQRPRDAKLLVIDGQGHLTHVPRAEFADHLQRGDLLVANDAATLPASLSGIHEPTGSRIELRLAGADALAPAKVRRFRAILFGDGDYRTRTEDRPAPPRMAAGDRLLFGPLAAEIERVLGHPRLLEVRFQGSPGGIWRGIAHHGRPIQYAHMTSPLALWDVWTRIAGPPVAFEPPSAGFVLDWQLIATARRRGVAFATITHAAGISSTGDPLLDAQLPFDEPYGIPHSTATLIRRTRASGGRVIAIGTTVVRALEDAARADGTVAAGEGVARHLIGRTTRLRVVDAILSGTHEPGTSHYELLRAFADEATLARADSELQARGYRTHEFGDSVFIAKRHPVTRRPAAPHTLRAGGSGARSAALRGPARRRRSTPGQFGHRIYRVRDPRADAIKGALEILTRAGGLDPGRLQLAEAVERAAIEVLSRHKPGRPLQTNLEFYTALLLEALGFPREAFTCVFAAGRAAGWVAHAREQVLRGRLIRPLSRYVGPQASAAA